MKIDELKKISEDIKTKKIKILKSTDKFQFKCTACGKCCFNIDVMISIYDLIRLRNALKLPTQEILKKGFIILCIGTSSGIPISIINFKKVNSLVTKCPFLSPVINFNDVIERLNKDISDEKTRKILIEKYRKNPKQIFKDFNGIKIDRWLCSIHKHRPNICRLYPLGRFKQYKKGSKLFTEKIFLQNKTDWCPGWKTKEKQTLKSFLDNSEFWHYKEGSDKSHAILNQLLLLGYIARTEDNKNEKVKPLFNRDSSIMMFIGNLLYNFDSINFFSKDKRVKKTIYGKCEHKDFMYVLEKVSTIIDYFIKYSKKGTFDKNDFKKFIN